MKSKKKWISILVLVAFICTIVPLPVLAAEMQDSLLVTEPNKQPLLSGAVTTENSTAQGVQLVEQNKTLSEATAAIAQEGVCGETLTWTLTADGVLTISGTGAMNQAFDRSLRSQVKELVFEEWGYRII